MTATDTASDTTSGTTSDTATDTPSDPMRWVFRGLLAGGTVLLAVSAVVIGLVALPEEKEKEKPKKLPTYGISYSVTGEDSVSVTFGTGGGRSERGGRLSPPQLPWTRKVAMPADGLPPAMEISLGEKGGRATCALTVDGRVVARSVAVGAYGRATCSAAAPTTAPPTAPPQ